MTIGPPALAASAVQLSPRDRRAILDNVLAALERRFYLPEKLNDDWRHYPLSSEPTAAGDAPQMLVLSRYARHRRRWWFPFIAGERTH